jgi:hypothetical protein
METSTGKAFETAMPETEPDSTGSVALMAFTKTLASAFRVPCGTSNDYTGAVKSVTVRVATTALEASVTVILIEVQFPVIRAETRRVPAPTGGIHAVKDKSPRIPSKTITSRIHLIFSSRCFIM